MTSDQPSRREGSDGQERPVIRCPLCDSPLYEKDMPTIAEMEVAQVRVPCSNPACGNKLIVLIVERHPEKCRYLWMDMPQAGRHRA
jgi:hypothetical protein